MAIESKNHRPSPVKAVQVSQASREMARGMGSRELEVEEELRLWTDEKLKIQEKLTAENERLPRDLERASAKCVGGGKAWFAKKSSIEVAHAIRRKELTGELKRIEENLREAKAALRDFRNKRIAKATNGNSNVESIISAIEPSAVSGTQVCHPILTALMLQELREIKQLLKERWTRDS